MDELTYSRYNIAVQINEGYILANVVTGAIVEMTPEEYCLFTNELKKLPESLKQSLNQSGFLIEAELDEIALLRRVYNKSKISSDIIRITICPTLDCNFSCPYCYEERKPGVMSKDIQNEVIHFVEGLLKKAPKKLSICWYGGEPLLYPGIIETMALDLSILCKKYSVKYECSMITNGYLITNEIVEILHKICCKSVQITMDGPPEIHNKRRPLRNGGKTFEKIFHAIELLDDANIKTRVRVNIDRDNFHTFSQMEKLFLHFNNVICYPAPVTVEKTQTAIQQKKCFTHQEYGDFYRKLADYKDLVRAFEDSFGNGVFTCMAENEYSYVIDPFGYLYKCMNDVGIMKYAVGSIVDNRIHSAIATAKYLGRDPFSEEECKDCSYLPLCYGRCVWEYKDKGTHACPAIKYCLTNILKRREDYEDCC